jgi:hypothetical protein
MADRVLVGNPRPAMNSTVSNTKRATRHKAAIRIRRAKHGDAAAIESLPTSGHPLAVRRKTLRHDKNFQTSAKKIRRQMPIKLICL